MKYYLHDTNSFNDEKITMLFMEFGYEGLGLFYTILEKIGMQEKPIKTEVLKRQLRVGKRLEKCWSFMEEIGIISSNNGETFNERILSYSETYQIKKEKTREKVAQWRENQSNKKNVTSYVPISNLPKVKESKVNRIVFSFREELLKNGFSENLVDDWLKVRKLKNNANTETALKSFLSEVEKSGAEKNEVLRTCIERSWSRFKKEWLDNLNKNSHNGSSQTNGKPVNHGKAAGAVAAFGLLAKNIAASEPR